MKKRILLIHGGFAYYPELNAYKSFFADSYDLFESSPQNLNEDYSKDILWYIMGYYPKKINAGFIIHDYRSLSVGRLRWLKDKIKRYFNHKPNLRIFLNEEIRDQMAFNDNVPYVLLDMGVPDIIMNYKDAPEKYDYDFCYVGDVSKEREIDKMIQGFLSAEYDNGKTLLLIGSIKDDIDKEFKNNQNIIFKGRVDQEQVFSLVQKTEYALCFIPKSPPYCYQTPTKLLEYVALGKKVLINNSKSNIALANKLNLSIFTLSSSQFPTLEELLLIKNNNFNPKDILWPCIIKNSLVAEYLI